MLRSWIGSLVVLGAAAVAGCGGEKVIVQNTTTVVHTVTTPGSAGPPSHPRSSTTGQTTQSTSTSTTDLGAPPSLSNYSSSLFTALAPADWTTLRDDTQVSTFRESKWSDPSDPSTKVFIDASGGETTSPSAKAASVRAATSTTPSYRELSFGPTQLNGESAYKWTFEVSGTRRVDYFLNQCGVGLAVLGSTPPARFASLAPTFARLAESVHANCGAGPPTSTGPPNSTGPPTSPSSFCDTHTCIENFDNGTGYIVQCADGDWSHSGGRPGACSYHGGETGRTYP